MKRFLLSLLMMSLFFMSVDAQNASSSALPRRTQTIAHRGYWRTEGSAQNSRASLQRAQELAIFASEIDIWITRDGHLMVNHDANYEDVVLQDTTFAACRSLRLSNGEKMPQLEDLLKILKKSKSPTKLVVEVKNHRDPQRSRDCAVAAVEAVRDRHLQDRVLYISFSIEACEAIHLTDPEAEVAYLNGDRTPAELHEMGLTGLDYRINILRQHPEWVNEAHALGMNVNVWTVDKPEDIKEMCDLGVDYITTNEPALCEQLLQQE